MDPALLREHEAFKRRAAAQPAVEKRKAKPPENESKSKKPRPSTPKSASELQNYKMMTGSSQYKFGVLAKIVKYMKERHQRGDTHPLNIEEILEETNQTDVTGRVRVWLSTEALQNNPKITVVDGESFVFKPKFNIRDRKGLLRLLDKRDQRGLGAVMMDDVQESLPNAEKAIKWLGDQVHIITRPSDKKQVLFYNDKAFQFTADEEFQKLWRSVPMKGLDDKKIEEYLEKHGITSMQDVNQKKVFSTQKRRKVSNKKRQFKSHNDHLGDLLQDYEEKK